MTTDQEAAWQEAMNKLGEQPITPASMDDLLTAVLGAKTSYFKLNTEQKSGTYPLFF